MDIKLIIPAPKFDLQAKQVIYFASVENWIFPIKIKKKMKIKDRAGKTNYSRSFQPWQE